MYLCKLNKSNMAIVTTSQPSHTLRTNLSCEQLVELQRLKEFEQSLKSQLYEVRIKIQQLEQLEYQSKC